jgi:hypothetical protein
MVVGHMQKKKGGGIQNMQELKFCVENVDKSLNRDAKLRKIICIWSFSQDHKNYIKYGKTQNVGPLYQGFTVLV